MLDITRQINSLLLDFFRNLDIIPKQYYWLFVIFIVLTLAVLAHILIYIITKKLAKRFELTNKYWTYAFVLSVKAPIKVLIWFIGLLWIAQIVATHNNSNINKQIATNFEIGMVLIIGWFFLRLISQAEKTYMAMKDRINEIVDISTINAVNKILKAVIVVATFVMILHTLGVTVSGVLAIGGVGGLAIGFAAQDLLANFFGALMIYIDKPFKIDEWIRSPDREIEGTVEEIGWRMTKLRTFNQRPLYVPNRVFTGIAVENASRMKKRQITETVGIRYQDLPKMEKIVAEIKQKILLNNDIDKDSTLIVSFTKYDQSSVNILIYCFTHATTFAEFSTVKQKVLLDIKNVVEENGADFAFPTSVVYLEKN